jgi:hypothetical protein
LGRLRGFPNIVHLGVGPHFDEGTGTAVPGAGAQSQGERRDAGVLIARSAFNEGQEDLHRITAADAFDEIGANAAIGIGKEFVHDFDGVDTAAENLGDFGLNTAVREFRELQQRHGEALRFIEGFEDL